MNALRMVAVSALLMTSQAYAVDSIVQGNLSAVPYGQANSRGMHFKLPLNGDTNNCVITISYGDKPGVMPNNDGDTHINGLGFLDRVNTYGADGTYTFSAKAKSGCTGQAKVTFTIGNPARAAMSTMEQPKAAGIPANPTMEINPRPDLTVTPSKFTKIVVSTTNALVGAPVEIKVYGVGEPDPIKQGCAIVMKPYDKATGKELWGGYTVLSGQGQQWPKTRTLSFKKPGTFVMTAEVLTNAAACGYQGPASIPGDLQEITVNPVPK